MKRFIETVKDTLDLCRVLYELCIWFILTSIEDELIGR